jgi:hypothetical protein
MPIILTALTGNLSNEGMMLSYAIRFNLLNIFRGRIIQENEINFLSVKIQALQRHKTK